MLAKQWLKRSLQSYSSRRDLQWRRIPEFARSFTNESPVVYYLAPDENSPSGGVRVIYRHVDLLNELGIPAAVIHGQSEFRCTWFENSTQVVSVADTVISKNDLVILPEYTAPWFADFPKDMRVIVFNQNAHHTFDAVVPGSNPYESLSGLEAILTVSDDGVEILSMIFPEVPVHKIRNVIDPAIFFPNVGAPQAKVAYVPTRRKDELAQLLHVLEAREEFKSGRWFLEPLTGLSEKAMAEALRDTSIFISLSHREGFGLPPAEAMACGAYVVGHPGESGGEFFDPTYCYPAHNNTQIAAAIIQSIQQSDETRRALGQLASKEILSRYSTEGMKQDLASFYDGLL